MKLWNLHQHLITDEIIVPSNGKWKYKQYVKGKPHDTGLKFYGLADDKWYLYDFWLYMGSESKRKHGGFNIVSDFLSTAYNQFPERPFIALMDSYYGSYGLAKFLASKNIRFLMSCQANQPSNLFSTFLHKTLQKGEWRWSFNAKLNAVSFFDRAKVNILTNLFHSEKMVFNTLRNQKIPSGIYYYHQHLGPIDHFDRLLHLYYPHRCSIRWTDALLLGLWKMAVNNTNVIAQELGYSTSLKQTMESIISHLTGDYTVRSPEKMPVFKQRFDRKDHWPKPGEKVKCVQCRTNGKNSNTSFWCTKCDVTLHPECFESYHTEM